MVKETAVIVSSERSPISGRPKGVIILFRYDLDTLHVGKRFDLVRQLTPLSIALRDEGSLEVVLKIYKIPENVFWSERNPGGMTSEFFRDELIAGQEIRFKLEDTGFGGSLNSDWKWESLNPETFFLATNGVAFMLSGEALPGGFNPGQIKITYTWENEN